MKPTPEQLAQDTELLRQVIELRRRHRFYDHTVEWEARCRAMVTGEGQDAYVTSLKTRETKEQKEQRIRITKSLTPYALSQVRAMYSKLRRVDNVRVEVLGADDKKVGLVKTAHQRYAEGQTLRDYIMTKVEHYSFCDPNAYLIAEREVLQDSLRKVVANEFYPIEVGSQDVMIVEHDRRGELCGLIVRIPYLEAVERDGVMQDIRYDNFYLYRKGYTVAAYCGPSEVADGYTTYNWKVAERFTNNPPLKNSKGVAIEEIATGGKSKIVSAATTPENADEEGRLAYHVKAFDTGLAVVPATVTGSDPDPTTVGRTRLPVWHAAKDVLEDLIAGKSEFDLTRLLHTFPQKVQYAPECEFERTIGDKRETCNQGTLVGPGVPPNTQCPSCKGSGVQVHTTAQEAIIVKWPRNKDSFIDLSKVAAYINPPKWLPEWQNEYVDKVMGMISLAVFNTEAFRKAEVVKTATEIAIEYDKIYDRLDPYATHVSSTHILFSLVHLGYLEVKDPKAIHEFPRDYKFESKQELLAQLALARTAGLGFHAYRAIERDLLEKLHQNDLGAVDEIMAFTELRPFLDLSEEQRMLTLATLPASHPLRVAYEFAYVITQRIEADLDGQRFSEFPVKRRRELWDAAVQQVIEQLPAGQALQQTRAQFIDVPDPEPIDLGPSGNIRLPAVAPSAAPASLVV